LSGGRLDVGVGAGWNEAEYEAAGIPFERPGVRLRQLEDTLATLRDLLGPEPSIPIRPAAVQRPHPPLWVGGRGDRLLEVVARAADGWNTVWAVDQDWYRQRLAVLEQACERVGRDPASVERSVGLYSLVGTDDRDLRKRFERMAEAAPPGVLTGVTLDEWKSGRLVGTVEEVRDRLGSWADLGVTTVIAGPGALPFSVIDPDDLQLLASAVP
jgi:alkanesulfonate monooxygenase SsuD/methylene tetrahydromethanopterin reductase-like flavin-dependent oxidoreductase (luciferase family)